MGEIIVSAGIFGLCACIMFGIGIWQIKSKEPVGFYSGGLPPKPEEISDVQAWNKGHGMLWVIYGVCMVLGWLSGVISKNNPIGAAICIALIALPLVGIVVGHKQLVKKYFVGKK